MASKPVIARPTPASIASYVSKNAGAVKRVQAAHHMAEQSVREADYKGHHIVIRTTYDIKVDGKRISGHMAVTKRRDDDVYAARPESGKRGCSRRRKDMVAFMFQPRGSPRV